MLLCNSGWYDQKTILCEVALYWWDYMYWETQKTNFNGLKFVFNQLSNTSIKNWNCPTATKYNEFNLH